MKTFHKKTFGIVIIYFVVGCLWILFTDRIFLRLFSDVTVLTHYQTFKGWFYVFGTTVLLFVLINRQLIKLGRINTELKVSNTSKTEMLAKLNQAQFNAKIGSWDWNLITGETWWSDQMYSILALSTQKPLLITDIVSTMVAPHDRQNIQVALQQLIEEQKSLNSDFSTLTASGQLKTLNLIGRAEVNREGRIIRVYGTLMDITDRKLAEEALVQSENMYRWILNSVDVVIYSLRVRQGSETQKVDFVSDQINTILGYSPEEFKNNPDLWSSLIHPDDIPRISEITENGFQTRQNMVRIYRMLHKTTGNYIWVEDHSQFLFDDHGNIICVFGSARDISERKKAEEALIEKEILYRTLIERLPDGVYKISQDNNFVEVNPALVKMLGYSSREELMSTDIHSHLLADRAVQDSFITRQMWNDIIVFKLRKKDGTDIWVENHGWLSSGENDDNLFYEGVIRNITDRKNAEDALRESQLLFENLTKASPSGIFRCGTDGYVTYFNPRWVELAGLPLDQALGFGWLNAVHPDDRNMLSEKWQSDESKKSESLEFRFLRPDGRVVYVIEYVVPEITDDQITGYIGTITDITERRHAEAEVVMLNADLEKRVARRTAQLKAANNELEAFSYSISHDLRAPLRALDAFAHFLIDDYSDVIDAEGRRMLQVIIDNANKMGSLIDDLLEFARLNRNSLNISKIDMQAMAQAVFDELTTGQPPDPGIVFRLHPLAEANGDAAMVKQVWTNLIGNAIKYTSKKSERIIEISCSKNDHDCSYKISDNGAGFNMAYYNKLFGVFQRLHTVKEFDGTGIGLAIVNRIVKRHNGRVWAEGEENKGATFYFALPRK